MLGGGCALPVGVHVDGGGEPQAVGQADEALEHFLAGGVIKWGPSVDVLLEEGEMLVNQVRAPDTRGFVSVLVEGPPNSGKTSLAATIAKASEFPFVKICSPEDMVGYSEAAKCMLLKKVFMDAYKSPFSIILVDNIERLLDYGPIGPRYSNTVLQALLVLLKTKPPPNRRLLVLATTSVRGILEDLGVVDAFTTTLHVSPLTSGDHVLNVVRQNHHFTAAHVEALSRKLTGKTCLVGVKKLLDIIDFVSQSTEEQRVPKFLCKLEEEAGLDPS